LRLCRLCRWFQCSPFPPASWRGKHVCSVSGPFGLSRSGYLARSVFPLFVRSVSRSGGLPLTVGLRSVARSVSRSVGLRQSVILSISLGLCLGPCLGQSLLVSRSWSVALGQSLLVSLSWSISCLLWYEICNLCSGNLSGHSRSQAVSWSISRGLPRGLCFDRFLGLSRSLCVVLQNV
jgi:hypothetical protein